MPPVIEVEGLRKEYRRLRGSPIVAVDGLDLAVPEGGVFGFLGPNGSGKTTTIRCLLGLVRPSAGRMRMLGASVPSALPSVLPRVGSIVESPAFFPTFSARRTLRLLGAHDGIGADRVEQVLARVGLADRAGEAVKGYSLGMRQRLGVAAALLKDPALLVLDEPANGLDPAGIREMRELLRSLAAEGRTVFVSSHLLSEVEQTCDHVAILKGGRCIRSGPVREVLDVGRAAAVLVGIDDLAAGEVALRAADFTVARHGGVLRVELGDRPAREVTRVLGGAGLWLHELRAEAASLEDVFLEVTGEPAAPPAPAWPTAATPTRRRRQ